MKNEPRQWSRLDNAAKVFPANSGKADTKVFRFACELTEDVDAEILEEALEKTLKLFPHYNFVMRHGLFWHYFESSDLTPEITQECQRPCRPMYDIDAGRLLYEVTYYRRRINVEVYHALTDGTGALQFLRVLVFHYLVLCHEDDFMDAPPKMDYDASFAQKLDDSFRKYYSGQKTHYKSQLKRAYKIKGQRISEHRIKVIEGIMNTQTVLAKARELKTTVTVMLTALLMRAIADEMSLREQKRPVVVSIPVNLRKYFESQTARNFFGVINIHYDFKMRSGTFDDLVAEVERQLKYELEKEQLEKRMNAMAALENNLLARMVPLPIKDIIIKGAVSLSELGVTASLSNIGRVSMPDAFKPYIRLFDVFVSTDKLQICMCSYEDHMVVTFTSAFVHTDIQRRFFRALTGMGVDVEIVSNLMEE